VFRELSAMPFAFGVSAVVFVGCAWAATALAAGASTRSASRSAAVPVR